MYKNGRKQAERTFAALARAHHDSARRAAFSRGQGQDRDGPVSIQGRQDIRQSVRQVDQGQPSPGFQSRTRDRAPIGKRRLLPKRPFPPGICGGRPCPRPSSTPNSFSS